ncbi:MAG: translation elongation factor-like protein [Elusimicrobia bacterium]|nr:translation elongation factor-like protein [Elusimicrobiota bacterium]
MLLGKVEDYFAHVQVAALTLKAALTVGDTIRIKGHTTDLVQKIESLQIDHKPVASANAGEGVGIKVNDRCRKGDRVYKI